jgi:hypothetical protein
MGSFDNQDPPICANEGCSRKAWCDGDPGGFLCHICNQRLINAYQGRSLRRRLSTDRQPVDQKLSLQDVLAVEAVGVQTMTGVLGDGWALQCLCRHCPHQWLNDGWVCPVDYYRRGYLAILDARRYLSSLDPLHHEDADWDAMVTGLHLELYPPPVSEPETPSRGIDPVHLCE